MSDVIYLYGSSPAADNRLDQPCVPHRRSVGEHATRALSAQSMADAIICDGVDGADHPPVLDMPRIVWIILRSARRFGRKPSSMPRFVAADLERHCALGDPTALLMRGWIANDSATLQEVPAPVMAAADRHGAGEG